MIGNSQVFEDIVDLIAHGDGNALVPHMMSEIELSINDEQLTLERNDAGKKLVEFFHEFPVVSMDVVHSGKSKGGHDYFIGQIEAEGAAFRIVIYTKEENDKHPIQSIEIEKS